MCNPSAAPRFYMQYYNRFLSGPGVPAALKGQKLHKHIYVYTHIDIQFICVSSQHLHSWYQVRSFLGAQIILCSVSKKSEANFCPHMKKTAVNTLTYFGESILLCYCFVAIDFQNTRIANY